MSKSADLNVRISVADFADAAAKADAMGLSTAQYVRSLAAVPIMIGSWGSRPEAPLGHHRPVVLSCCTRTAFVRFKREVSSWASLISQADRALGAFSMAMFYEPGEFEALQDSIDGALSCARSLHESFSECYRLHLEPASLRHSERRGLRRTLRVRLSEGEKRAVVESAQLLGVNVSVFVRNMLAIPLDCSEPIIRARGATSDELLPLLCDTTFLERTSSAIRERGQTLNRAVHGLNSIRLQPTMPYKEKRRLFECADEELRSIEGSAPELSRMLEDIGGRRVLVW